MKHQKISHHQLPIDCNCVTGCLSLVLQDFLPEEWCWQHKRTKIKALEVAFCESLFCKKGVVFSVKTFGFLQVSPECPKIQVWADAIDLSGRGSSTSRPRRVVFHYTDVPWQEGM